MTLSVAREPGQPDSSWVERNVGNVTEDSELTFEYGIRRKQKVVPEPIIEMELEPKIRSDPELEPKIGSDPELEPKIEVTPKEIPPADTDPKPKELGATCKASLYLLFVD